VQAQDIATDLSKTLDKYKNDPKAFGQLNSWLNRNKDRWMGTPVIGDLAQWVAGQGVPVDYTKVMTDLANLNLLVGQTGFGNPERTKYFDAQIRSIGNSIDNAVTFPQRVNEFNDMMKKRFAMEVEAARESGRTLPTQSWNRYYELKGLKAPAQPGVLTMPPGQGQTQQQNKPAPAPAAPIQHNGMPLVQTAADYDTVPVGTDYYIYENGQYKRRNKVK
jgi:hypothetical protein